MRKETKQQRVKHFNKELVPDDLMANVMLLDNKMLHVPSNLALRFTNIMLTIKYNFFNVF